MGAYFPDSLASDIDSLQLHAGIHPIQFGRFYRLLSKRFPYAVYYQIENDTALLRAAFDLRRDPAWMAAKMRNR